MVSQDLGMHSSKLFVRERRNYNLTVFWEECIQEESRVANQEYLLSRDEDQALATHTKGGRKKSYF